MVVFLFNAVIYVFFIFMSMYSYFMFMYLHRASWHSSATLTEAFPCFFQLKGKCQGKTRKDGALPSSFQNFCFVLCVCFVSFCVLCVCVCVCVYCTTATGWLPNCSQQIYHIKYENTKVVSGIEPQSETLNLCYWLILLIRILFWTLQLADKHSVILEIMDSALSHSIF